MTEDPDNYDLQLLDGAYAMLRPEEHTAMVPAQHRERVENWFKSQSESVNCLVCTPTLELGIDIGQLDAVLMRNVLPLPANYWQRAGRRHRMAVDVTYCRPASHDRAYFAAPPKLLGGRIDPAGVQSAYFIHVPFRKCLLAFGFATTHKDSVMTKSSGGKGGGGKGGGGKGGGQQGGQQGGGKGGKDGGWSSTTGNPSGGGRSNNPPGGGDKR